MKLIPDEGQVAREHKRTRPGRAWIDVENHAIQAIDDRLTSEKSPPAPQNLALVSEMARRKGIKQ